MGDVLAREAITEPVETGRVRAAGWPGLPGEVRGRKGVAAAAGQGQRSERCGGEGGLEARDCDLFRGPAAGNSTHGHVAQNLCVVGDRSPKAFAQVDLGLPTEELLGAGDVGLAHLRIIHR